MTSKQVLFGIMLIAITAMTVFSYQLYYNNENLNKQIIIKDKFIANKIKNDSIYNYKTKKYSDIITKYISDCNIYINKRKISTPELITILNRSFIKNDSMKIEIQDLKSRIKNYEDNIKNLNPALKEFESEYDRYYDSTYLYKNLTKLYEKDYGNTYNYKTTKNGYTFIRNITAADSALALLPYYRDKVKIDSTGKYWLISNEKSQIRNSPNKPLKGKFLWPFKKNTE